MPAACDDVLERSTNSPLTIDVRVVDVLAETGITDKVARLVPIAIVKGWMERSVTLVLTGDVMFGRGIDQILPHPGDPRLYEVSIRDARDYVALAERAHGPIPRRVDEAYVWGDALAALRATPPHARIVNLETSITTSENFSPKGINYRMNPTNIGCLAAASVDCCVLANNHVLDWGEAGLLETLDTLKRAGIRYAGAGRNAEEVAAPAIIDVVSGYRIAVFAFGLESSGIPHSWRFPTSLRRRSRG